MVSTTDFQFSNCHWEDLYDKRRITGKNKKHGSPSYSNGAILPKGYISDVLAKQIVWSATSTAANYRTACKARSHKDFVNKLGICEEEADETQL